MVEPTRFFTGRFEQVLEAAPYKTRSFTTTFHLIDHPIKTQLEKAMTTFISDVFVEYYT